MSPQYTHTKTETLGNPPATSDQLAEVLPIVLKAWQKAHQTQTNQPSAAGPEKPELPFKFDFNHHDIFEA